MIISTTDIIPAKEITEILGIARGSTVRARNVGRDILTVLFLVLTCLTASGQYQEVEQVTLFGQRLDNPIKIEVTNSDDQILFSAINRSLYPYQLSIHFSILKNLTPESLDREFIIAPGSNRLFTLTIKDKLQSPDFQYSWSYRIGEPDIEPDLSFPYIIPVSSYKSFEMVYFDHGPYSFMVENFMLNKGDTVYSMRKGFVTAVPAMFNKSDRISKRESLEIRHNDGTIMVYENLNPDSVFVKPGTIVYPNQPLGIIGNDLNLVIALYTFQEENKIKRLRINYYMGEGKTGPFSPELYKVRIWHPAEIITREMTKSEKKKFEKSRL